MHRSLLTLALTLALAPLGATALLAPTAAVTEPVGVVVKGKGHAGGDDVVKVNARKTWAGQTARLYRVKNGEKVKLASKELGSRGNARFRIKDHNGVARTRYRVMVPHPDGTHVARGDIRLH